MADLVRGAAAGTGALDRTIRRLRRNLAPVVRDAVLNVAAAAPLVPPAPRRAVLNAGGHRLSSSASMLPRSFLGHWRGLVLGDRVFVNYGCFFDLAAETRIGADTHVGYQVAFLTATHDPGAGAGRVGAARSAAITVGRGCWIGARATVLPGVSIGDHCVVAAGSVVAADCAPNGLYAGVPATRRRELPPLPIGETVRADPAAEGRGSRGK